MMMNMVSSAVNGTTQLANWLMSKPVVQAAGALDDGNNPAGLIVRDSLQNFGMIQEAKEKSPEYGQEMSLIMWGTAFIWGGGSFLLKGLYEGLLHQTGALPFLNAIDSPEQKTALAAVKTYSSNKFSKTATPQLQQQLEKRLSQLESSLKIPAPARKIAQAVGIGLSVVLPSYLVGVKLQEVAHHRSHSKSQAKREALYQHVASHWQPSLFALDVNTKKVSPQSSEVVVDAGSTTSTPTSSSLNNAPRQAATGGNALANGAIAAVDFFNNHEAITNLVFVDGFITGGRLVKSEGNYDRLGWGINEAIVIFMVYFGSQLLNNALKQSVFDSAHMMGATPVSQLSFEAVEMLRDHYGKPNQNLRTNYQQSLAQLGLSSLWHQDSKVNQAKAKEILTQHASELPMEKDVLAHASVALTPNDTYFAETLLANQSQIADAIQTHMAKTVYKPGENIIIDTLIANGTLPVWKEDFKPQHLNPFSQKAVLGQDITQPLNHAEGVVTEVFSNVGCKIQGFLGFKNPKQGILDNFTTVEGVFHKLHQLAQHEEQATVTSILDKGILAKGGALAGSLLISYAILGVASPKLQHYIAGKFSGEALPDRLNCQVNNDSIRDEIVAKAIKKKLNLQPSFNAEALTQLPALKLGQTQLYPLAGGVQPKQPLLPPPAVTVKQPPKQTRSPFTVTA